MTDRYTTAGYIIIGLVTTIAIPAMLVVASIAIERRR